MNEILKVENLSYYYMDGGKENIILENVDFSFEKDLFYAIIGESGSGKTTFLSLIAGLDEPKSGRILYEGKDIVKLGLSRYRQKYAAMIFQNYNLIPYLNAYDNVATALSIAKKKIDKNTVLGFLERFGIDGSRAKRKVEKLSGGEQQRVAIARAIAVDVDLIIADEPTGNLDINNSEAIINIFKELSKVYHKTVIMVTHNEKNARAADRVVRIDRLKHCLVYDGTY